MKRRRSGGNLIEDGTDGELTLIFLTELHALEQALIRAGYTQARAEHGAAQPDWARFLRHIEPRFDPDSTPELQGAVSYLLCAPDKMERRQRRLESSLPHEVWDAEDDLIWMSELVVEAKNKLTFGLPPTDTEGFDFAYVLAALLVIDAWSYCDPHVERLLGQTQ